jgi:prepilin-type N-terminal cleavage/methylation domain-containing protein
VSCGFAHFGSAPRGFTLLEMLLVVLIVAALAAIVTPRFLMGAERAKRNACAQNVAIINHEVERWHFEKGVWPAADLSDLAADTARFPDGLPTCPVDGSAYALDPTTHRVGGHNHLTPSAEGEQSAEVLGP